MLGIFAVGSVLAEGATPDSRTSLEGGLKSNTARAHDWRKFSVVVGSSNNFRSRRRGQTSATQDPISRNAIGVGTNRLDRSNGASPGSRDPAPVAGYGPPATSGTTVKHELGTISSPTARLDAKTNVPTARTVSHSVINGSGLSRPGSGLAVLGGPAKDLSGAINGSNFRLRHP